MISTETRREQLLARKRELENRLVRIDSELDQPHSAMFAEAAIEREGDEALEDLGAAGMQEIRMIDAALDRIARGEYGFCVECGERIAEARLNVVPAAPKCQSCAAG